MPNLPEPKLPNVASAASSSVDGTASASKASTTTTTAASVQSKSAKTRAPLQVIEKLGPHDVLLGRGAPISEHDGNVRIRKLCIQRQTDYANAIRRRDKHRVAMEIVKTVQMNGGRFLRRIGSSANAKAQWEQVDDLVQILGKVRQSF